MLFLCFASWIQFCVLDPVLLTEFALLCFEMVAGKIPVVF